MRARNAVVFRAGRPTEALNALAEGIEKARLGLSPAWCQVVAEGYVARLHRAVWSALSDVLGSTEDVEKLLGWPGPPELLALALADAGYIRQIDGVWYCVSAVSEAPEYVRKRWIRQKRGLYQAAVRRANPPALPDQAAAVAIRRRVTPDQSLFAMERPDEPRSRDVKATVDYWAARYYQVYSIKYPFRPSDFGLLRHFCTAVPSADERARIIDNYLACRQRFFAGHSINFLVRFLPRWRAAVRGREYDSQCNLADLIRQPFVQRGAGQDGSGAQAGGSGAAVAGSGSASPACGP